MGSTTGTYLWNKEYFLQYLDIWASLKFLNSSKILEMGKGLFGEVWYGKWTTKVGIFDVAIKKLRFKEKDKDVEKKKALKEAELMKKLQHDKIVRLWCICTIDEPMLIVMEYMVNGSLLDYMRNGKGSEFNFNIIINIAAQIADGMKYLACFY